MRNGTICLIRNRDWGNDLENLVTGIIVDTTDSEFIHVEEYLNGKWYEFTFPEGANTHVKDLVAESTKYNHKFREPIRELTEKEVGLKLAYWHEQLKHKRSYNIIKLILLYIIYPTRRFWNWLGWVPFSNTKWFGAVCSVGIEESNLAASIDTTPGESHEYRSPGNFDTMAFYRDVEYANT